MFRGRSCFAAVSLIGCLLGIFSVGAFGQSTGTLRGTVMLADSDKPVHNVRVTITQLRRSAATDDNGKYEFQEVPPGRYDITAHLDLVPDVVKNVQVAAGSPTTVDFQIQLSAVREQITITASGNEETTFNSLQSVSVIGALDLAKKNPGSLGEALENEAGVAKRSSGPGSSRPVIRGFDGDRVLVLQNGQRIGALGSQSGDHGEPVDVLSADRVEVVKGPGTLLYGSNAIGGVVNAVSAHDESHPGIRGSITGIGSTNNYQAGGSAGIEYGTKNWLFWANGGGMRAGDYNTPLGRLTNSYTRDVNASGGVGYFPGKGWFSADYSYDNRKYGIPFDVHAIDAELVYLTPRRQSLQVRVGARDLNSFVSDAQVSLQYNNYKHDEVNGETGEINTAFKNNTFVYRGVLEERKHGRFSGSFGLSGYHRDYKSEGEEALAPPTTQNNFAVFGLQTITFEYAALQFGGRVEYNGYKPEQLAARSFTGFSGGIGLRIPLGHGTAFVTNYTHSYRAPALEELYNNGPHAGNLTFEIGNHTLKRESSDGIDFSLRHSSGRLRAELNYYYYRINDFVYLAPTGDIREGLIEANYSQGKGRFTGTEARLDIRLFRSLWLLSSLDYVNAELTETATPLPRIPPLRGHIGFEAFFKGFRVNPEVTMTRDQDRVFTTETRTAGYTTVSLTASYTFAQQHQAQILSVSAFNLTDRLYRNHLSFLKDFAPEMGRGVRLVYTLRFF